MMRTLLALCLSLGAVAASAGPELRRPPRAARRSVRSPRPISGVRRAERWLPSLRTIRDHEIGLACLAALIGGVVLPPLILAAPLVLAGEAVRRERAAATARRRALVRTLPDTIDQLGLAVAAGLTLPGAMRQVQRWLPEPIGTIVEHTLERLDAGSPLIDALAHLADALPSSARRPITVIVAATRDGAPLGPSLARAADEARQTRRRDAEVRARRLPVLMLMPLVLCVLPAFVLLTLVPLIVGSLDGLSITDGFPDP